MNPANYREALIEARADESEGADILLVGVSCFIISITLNLMTTCCTEVTSIGSQVKPGLPYLDIVRLLRDTSPLPIAAYQVSSIAICLMLPRRNSFSVMSRLNFLVLYLKLSPSCL